MSDNSGHGAKAARRSRRESESESESDHRRRKDERSSKRRSREARSHGYAKEESRSGDGDERHSRQYRRDRRSRADDEDGDVDMVSRRDVRRYRDRSASRDHSHDRRRSRSPPSKRRRRSHDPPKSPQQLQRSRAPLPSQNESFRGTKDVTAADGPPIEKQKPNYKPTGLLAKEANTVAGTTTVLKYHEPPEARKPSSKDAWRVYVFKQKDLLDTIYLQQRSAWLMGRDQKVTDLLLEHPSISKQHAVIQFRYITSTNEFGDKSSKVKPYLIDLESANGTKLNSKKVEASRYVELVDGDVMAFGDSEREYVLMLPPA